MTVNEVPAGPQGQFGVPQPAFAAGTGPNPIEVSFADPAAQQRVTVLIRVILAIPHLVVLWVLAIAAEVVAVIGWFGALFTGRLPDFAAQYLTGFLHWQTRVFAYLLLLTDEYPPFSLGDADYPVRLAAQPGPLNRLAVLFRAILSIPAYIVLALAVWGADTLVLFITWLIVLITGRMPEPLHQALASVVRYTCRFYGYVFMLTSQYPAGLFGDPPGLTGTTGTQAPAVPGGPMTAAGPDSGPGGSPTGQYPPPAGQHQTPTGQYETPTGQYQTPTGQYQTPTGQYQAPTGQHEAPTGQYETPTGQYQAPSGQYPPAAGSAEGQAPPAGQYPAPGAGAYAGQTRPVAPGGGAYPGPPGGWPTPPPAVLGPPPWPLVLSATAKKLVGLFLALGVVAVVGYVVLIVVVAGGTSKVVIRANAINTVHAAGNTLDGNLTSFATKASACSTSSNQLHCVQSLDLQLSRDFDGYAATIQSTPMPNGSTSADASQLSSVATKAGQIFQRLGTATSVAQYQSLAASSDIQQAVDQVVLDSRSLGAALNAS